MFILREFILDHIEGARQHGDEFKGRCPFCEVMDGRFSVNAERGAWQCFRGKCGKRGSSIIGLVAQVYGVSWREARELMGQDPEPASEFHELRMKHKSAKPAQTVLHPLPEHFIPCFDPDREAAFQIPKKLGDRITSKQVIKDYSLGFCVQGPCAGRVVIPISGPSGESWTARDITGKSAIKYMNPQESDASMVIGGMHMLEDQRTVVLVEGPFDALRLAEHGILAFWLGGKNLSKYQKQILINALQPDSCVVVLMDPSEPPSVSEAIAGRLCLNLKVKIAKLPTLPEHDDPGSSTLQQAQRAMMTALQYE